MKYKKKLNEKNIKAQRNQYSLFHYKANAGNKAAIYI